MKRLTFLLICIIVGIWSFAVFKWIGFEKPNTVKVTTTANDYISPTPTTLELSPQVATTSSATSSSFVVASPSVAVLRY